MIKVGEYQILKIYREMPQGFYLTDGTLRQSEEEVEEEEDDDVEYDQDGNEIVNPFAHKKPKVVQSTHDLGSIQEIQETEEIEVEYDSRGNKVVNPFEESKPADEEADDDIEYDSQGNEIKNPFAEEKPQQAEADDDIEYDSQGNEIKNPFAEQKPLADETVETLAPVLNEEEAEEEADVKQGTQEEEEVQDVEETEGEQDQEEGDEDDQEYQEDQGELLNEVLLPGSSITPDMKVGDEIEVFVYCDSEDRDVATTKKPYLTVGQFAFLKVSSVTNIGAFCDWGMPKDLLVPFSNQATKMMENRSYVVHMYLDEYSDRLVGSTKLNQFLINAADDGIKKGQKVNLLVEKETDIGYKVIINQRYGGLLYRNEVPRELEAGDELIGYIKLPRDDGKIDVSVNAIGYESISKNEQSVLDKLNKNDGFMPYHDKSDPDSIRDEFGMSKKLFKKVLGSLYKQRRIIIEAGEGFRISSE